MRRILLVSKPIAPPWNDGSKNLVRVLARHMQSHLPTVMTSRGSDPGIPGVRAEAVYRRGRSRFAPALVDNAAVFARLLFGEAHDVWHFFFAPNQQSARAGRVAKAARRVATVQTVCSAPRDDGDLSGVLFADVSVVLSRHTERRLIDGGASPDRLRRIPPAVEPLATRPPEERGAACRSFDFDPARPVIIYPGDLEFSGGAERVLRAHALLPAALGAQLVMACRAKTRDAQLRERQLRELAKSLGRAGDVRFVGETPRIIDLLASADVVALPADNFYAKVDYPLTLIEAMLLERAVVVLDGTSAAELAESGAAVTCEHDPAAVAEAMRRLLEDNDARRRLGEGARVSALHRFDPARMTRQYEMLYEEMLG